MFQRIIHLHALFKLTTLGQLYVFGEGLRTFARQQGSVAELTLDINNFRIQVLGADHGSCWNSKIIKRDHASWRGKKEIKSNAHSHVILTSL